MDSRARFDCAVCAAPAGTLHLGVRDGRPWLTRDSFTSVLQGPVAADTAARLAAALVAGDARTVHQLDLEYAPFYCPSCAASYCGAHWRRWDVFDDDGWHDSIRGRCPRNHERMLED